jgi:hypothetical protein
LSTHAILPTACTSQCYCRILHRNLHIKDQPGDLTFIVSIVFGTNAKAMDLEARRINSNLITLK